MKNHDSIPDPETVRKVLSELISVQFTREEGKYVVDSESFDADLIDATIEYIEHQKNPRPDRCANRPFATDDRFVVRNWNWLDADFLNKYYQWRFYEAIGSCTSVYELIDCLEAVVRGRGMEGFITSCILHITNTIFPVSDPEFHARMQKRFNVTPSGHFFVCDPA